MITLPFPPRRSQLLVWWLGFNLMVLLTCTCLAIVFKSTSGIWVVLGMVVVLSGGGLLRKEAILSLYRLWKNAAKVVAGIGQWWVLAVMYYLVLSCIGRAGSRLELGPPSPTMWRPRALEETLGSKVEGPRRRLIGSVVEGVKRHRGHTWWLVILPFLVILSLLRTEAKADAVPSNIYTLY